jgi:membrane protease subunit (stomatin/prohibitin family)
MALFTTDEVVAALEAALRRHALPATPPPAAPGEERRFCTACGAHTAADARFCAGCGQPVAPA